MTQIPVHNVGSAGIVKDIPDHLLPPEAWSDGKNIRFIDNKVKKFPGEEQVFGTPLGGPKWVLPVKTPTDNFWAYTDDTKVYATDGDTHTEITRASGVYAPMDDDLWNGGNFGGIAILNNGIDLPQFWAPVGLGQPLQDLTNWPVDYRCRVMRPFGVFLIALGITKAGDVFPHMVKWSHPAVPGALPSSWDETDPTKDAGERDLVSPAAGLIRDGRQLGNIFVIYKDQSTWGMQFIGGQDTFRTWTIFPSTGILASECMTWFERRGRVWHFVHTGDDIIIHDGQSPESLIEKRHKRFLNRTMDQTYFGRSFCIAHPSQSEIWFCYPELGQEWPTLAFVWNYSEGTQSFRELRPDTTWIASGPIAGVESTSWDSNTNTWDDAQGYWDQQTFRPSARELLRCNPLDNKFLQLDRTNTFDGAVMNSFIERTGLAIVGQDRQGSPKVDFESRKLVTRIWPKITGGPVTVHLGHQERNQGSVNWTSSGVFNPANQTYIDLITNGRLIAIRFESSQDVEWELEGYDLDMTVSSGL